MFGQSLSNTNKNYYSIFSKKNYHLNMAQRKNPNELLVLAWYYLVEG